SISRGLSQRWAGKSSNARKNRAGFRAWTVSAVVDIAAGSRIPAAIIRIEFQYIVGGWKRLERHHGAARKIEDCFAVQAAPAADQHRVRHRIDIVALWSASSNGRNVAG